MQICKKNNNQLFTRIIFLAICSRQFVLISGKKMIEADLFLPVGYY